MTEVQILTAVKNNGGSMEYTALLNQNITDTNRDPVADEVRIKQMIESKLLDGDTKPYNLITIRDEGRLHLQDAYYLEQQKQKFAKDVANKDTKKNRHDWHIALVSGLVAGVIAFVCDLMINLIFK